MTRWFLVFIGMALVALGFLFFRERPSAGPKAAAVVKQEIEAERKEPASPLLPARAEPRTDDTGSPSPLDHGSLFGPSSEASLRSYLEAVVRSNRDLQLDDADLRKLVAIVIDFQRVKCEIEAKLPTKTHFDGKTITVEFPIYPVEGRALRDAFLATLQREFPDGKADHIDDHLGFQFDSDFHGFGTMEQTMKIRAWEGDPRKFFVHWETSAVGNLTPSGIPQKQGRLMGQTGSSILSLDEVAAGPHRNLHRPILQAFGKR